MKLQLIKTKESDGNWLKVYLDNQVKCVVNYGKYVTEGEALERATEIYEFIKENKGEVEIIKEEEV